MAEKKKGEMGRPSSYTPEMGREICALIAEGRSLRSICREDEFPALRTVMYWLSSGDHDDFLQHYIRAREQQGDALVEEIHEAAMAVSSDTANADRVKIDALKWIAARRAPKKYGDRLELAGEVATKTMTDEQLDAKLTAMLAKAEKAKG